MKYSKTLTFGIAQDRPWKHIVIDYPYGHPIRVGKDVVGGFLIRKQTYIGGIKAYLIEGIEIEPEFRNRGIANHVIKTLLTGCDVMIGSITDDESKGFWKKMGAEFSPIPLESFPDNLLPSIHTKDPLFFWITKNPEARKLAMRMGEEVPKLMKEELPKIYANNRLAS